MTSAGTADYETATVLNAIIGVNPGSSGTVSVDGAGALFTNDYQSAGEFYVGYAGNGLMTVTNGGTIMCPNWSIGGQAGGPISSVGYGEVIVDHSYLYMTNSTQGLNIGTNGGSGVMQISNGGVVTGMFAAGLGLGYNSGSGTLSVSSGSQFYGGITPATWPRAAGTQPR